MTLTLLIACASLVLLWLADAVSILMRRPKPRVLIYQNPPIDEANLQRIFANWSREDERLRAIFQLMQQALDQAQMQGTEPPTPANTAQIAHANGGAFHLEMLQASIAARLK